MFNRKKIKSLEDRLKKLEDKFELHNLNHKADDLISETRIRSAFHEFDNVRKDISIQHERLSKLESWATEISQNITKLGEAANNLITELRNEFSLKNKFKR